jgi:hypothetical protein
VFVVDEATYVVFCGVGSGAFFTMLLDAQPDVVGEAYVETSGAAGEDVDVEVVFALRRFRRITEVVAEEKQIPPLRCGMTNKRVAGWQTKGLRDDKQKGYGMTTKGSSENNGNCKSKSRFLRFAAE